MYTMLGTHPDLAFAVSKLSRFSSNPMEQHLKAAKHVLRYLRRMSTLKLRYGSDGDIIPHAYSDSDWGSDKDRWYSVTGYVFMLAGGVICWSSSRQKTMALSSTEAEYMAISKTTKHAIWLCIISSEIRMELSDPTIIYGDNQGSIN